MDCHCGCHCVDDIWGTSGHLACCHLIVMWCSFLLNMRPLINLILYLWLGRTSNILPGIHLVLLSNLTQTPCPSSYLDGTSEVAPSLKTHVFCLWHLMGRWAFSWHPKNKLAGASCTKVLWLAMGVIFNNNRASLTSLASNRSVSPNVLLFLHEHFHVGTKEMKLCEGLTTSSWNPQTLLTQSNLHYQLLICLVLRCHRRWISMLLSHQLSVDSSVIIQICSMCNNQPK